MVIGPVAAMMRDLRDGVVTAEQLVETCRTASCPSLVPDDDALAAARAADHCRLAGAQAPLLGLPIAVRPGVRARRDTGAVVVGTTRRPVATLASGIGAVLDRPGSVFCRDAIDLPLLATLVGVCAPVPEHERLVGVRIGVRGWAGATLTAATRLSEAGIVVVEANRETSRHTDVLITDRRRPGTPSIRVGDLTLIGHVGREDLLFAVAAMIGQPG
ncbi:MAG TPA: hypothetical protein VG247_17470 [Pseudonocardiaceae bacterium]|jgi:hypothetical protein|nr:hypothetical protein [Pseudonocardiaceae bacterium]